ncbi:amino acid adenylation domain-containing protein [Streptomyces sp. Y1]|uniref:Amino acid adenylation domain-containing protein n=1 Tax=Streptomyces sp. Y1 TaxID=3238634 RepID=A0AB39TWC3_9ACTN
MSEIDDRLAALTPEQRALFEKLLAESGQAEDSFPLSVTQQGIWFQEQLHPNNPAYVIPAAARLDGPLDTAVLRAALREIVRRHESLRTTFELRDGQPVQVVRAELPLDLTEEDLGAGGLDEELFHRRMSELRGEPFDLAAGPLLRLRLLHVGPQEAVLLVAMHHLVSDGWSVGVLVSELLALYEAFAAGRPSPLPDLEIHYGDFAGWQQQWLRDADLTADLAYWRAHLAGAPAALALPTDRPRPAVQGFHGASVPFALPEPLMRELGALAKRHGATTYMALLAAFQVLLHRHADQDDVVVGVPTAGRGRAEVEPLIGFFVNTLPVRTDLSGNPDFVQVLTRTRDACLGLYAHQDVPFERIVTELRPARDLSRPPVFQTCLTYQSDPLPARESAGLRLRRLPVRAEGARFDLELQCFDDNGGLHGWFEYDRDLFDERTVARMADHLRRIVEGVVADPRTPVGHLPLLDDGERAGALAAGTGPDAEWPGRGWIHQCFEEAARRTPAAEAVRFEGDSLDYAELNRRANRLAHRLRRSGVGRDVLVGVAMERSPDLVVSLLAVLKAGGAYVPLDPGHPPDRLAYLLRDARAPVLLTQARVRALLPATDAEILCVDELAEQLAAESADDPEVAVDGEDLAYVIHTSGSTGRPKGVMNVHAAIRNRLLWMQDAFPIGPGDRVLQKTPFSFDVSVWEFFWPLMTGATLVVARPEGHRDSRYLIETIRAEAITAVHFVPSMLQVLLREPDVEECTSLRHVVCSGEALPRRLAQAFLDRSGARLHNLYGPTEAAIDVTAWTCRRDEDPRPLPIGLPIANTRVHVLDRHLRPVPPGVPGELHLGGRNLARGYLNRPELTAERFVEDPFAPGGGARLYRTGDLARRREDGALEYLGRLDHQVKLRGLRVEPGEIEAALTAHERVREALVLAHEHGPDDVRLVAYLTGEDVPPAGRLAEFLRRRLPEYMVPSHFTVLPALPLTVNGKVDRAALPAPGADRPELRSAFAEPRDELERAIAALWCRLLGVERVGVQDSFFDLGGHSLLLARLRVELAETMRQEVSMVELFQYPTVASLAAFLNRPGSAAPGTAAPGAPAPSTAARERAEARRQTQDQRQRAAARRTHSRKGR